MLNMQTFYEQTRNGSTSYLNVLRRVFHFPRETVLKLAIADVWGAWGE